MRMGRSKIRADKCVHGKEYQTMHLRNFLQSLAVLLAILPVV